jgi:hypothetical protein
MTKTDNATPSPARNDWAGQASSVMIWWGLPLAGVMFVSLLHLSFHASAALVAAAFTWMAIGCLLNALRRHRVHCYILLSIRRHASRSTAPGSLDMAMSHRSALLKVRSSQEVAIVTNRSRRSQAGTTTSENMSGLMVTIACGASSRAASAITSG